MKYIMDCRKPQNLDAAPSVGIGVYVMFAESCLGSIPPNVSSPFESDIKFVGEKYTEKLLRGIDSTNHYQ